MPVVGKFVQTSTERKRYVMDYSAWLTQLGETIQAINFATVVNGTSTMVPMVADAYLIDDPALTVTLYVSGGISGVSYKLLATMTTTAGQIKEDEILFRCQDP